MVIIFKIINSKSKQICVKIFSFIFEIDLIFPQEHGLLLTIAILFNTLLYGEETFLYI